jgi:hypothetical protein
VLMQLGLREPPERLDQGRELGRHRGMIGAA